MLGLGASEPREPDEGNLGELLKSQLVEPEPRCQCWGLCWALCFLAARLGNFVGGLKLRKEVSPAPGAGCSLTALLRVCGETACSEVDSWTPEWATRRVPSPTRDTARLGAEMQRDLRGAPSPLRDLRLRSLDASLSDLLPDPRLPSAAVARRCAALPSGGLSLRP